MVKGLVMVSMATPDSERLTGPMDGPPSPPPLPEPRTHRLDTLLACLTLQFPRNLPSLRRAVKTAIRGNGVPFEVIAGAPISRYGARLTFGATGNRWDLARALGLAGHPWGAPTFVGIRVLADGTLHAKPYHRLA